MAHAVCDLTNLTDSDEDVPQCIPNNTPQTPALREKRGPPGQLDHGGSARRRITSQQQQQQQQQQQ
jgi:hypothetical protein